MAIFGFSLDELKEILKESETRILARINQLDKRLASMEENLMSIHFQVEELKTVKNSIEEIKNTLSGLSQKKNSRGRSNSKGKERDQKLLEFLSSPHNTNEVCDKFGYSRSYASFILNKLKKKGVIKISKKVGNIPYFLSK